MDQHDMLRVLRQQRALEIKRIAHGDDNSPGWFLFLFPSSKQLCSKQFCSGGNNFIPALFYYVDVSAARLQPDSFEELAMPLFDQLYNFAHWLTQNREEAEDLVQETYAKALKGFSSFQLGTNFRAWMYRILRNSFLTSRTGLRATMTVPLDPDDDAPELAVELDTPESILIERSSNELMQRAIDELPVHFREVILLCEVEEMSYQEIAETISIPIGTVMSRLSRARRMLRDSLQRQLRPEAELSAAAQKTSRT
jgi:RNA polymerase sigma-70 factor (ECF subfamily)